ncbi:MAG: hypothetical protein KF832_24145 [Caldilineaceae bacterium]|nr:hypothetical protein [Caldilineaceae bacterium]
MQRLCRLSAVARYSSVGTLLALLTLALFPLRLWAHPLAVSLRDELVVEVIDLAIDVPTLTAPAAHATTTGTNYPPLGMPTLAWAPVANAQKYGVEISTSAGFATVVAKADSYGTSHTPQKTLADGEYFWRVRAHDGKAWGPYSEVRAFRKDWSDGGTLLVTLLSPPDNAERTAFTNEDFAWQPLPGAALYQLDISPDPSFSNLTYTAKTLTPHHTPIKRLPNNLYYWRVIPIDNQDHFGTPSAVRTFTFTWNRAPQPLAPAADAELNFVPRFGWTAVEAARKYELQVSTQPDFGTPNTYQTVNTEYTPEKALSNDQDYFWRVKAIDQENGSSPWSEVRHFRAKWNFQARLLAPVQNTIKQSHPFFAWTPIPGAERYQLRVDESNSFSVPLMDEKFYNVTTGALTKLASSTIYLDTDYFWQVRGIDAEGNYTPWSDIHTFRFGYSDVSPNQVYPLPYYQPDTANLPVHGDRTIASPLFVWDSALRFADAGKTGESPAYYELTVAADPAFRDIRFQIETTGPAAAPTLAHPFHNLENGQLYYWRVRAYANDSTQIGVDQSWVTRIDQATQQLLPVSPITPIYPRNGFESIVSPPLLGWQPVTDAKLYRVQVSSDAGFTTLVDEAVAQYVNYAPGQGRRTALPMGTYWWRVRPETANQQPLGDWSAGRWFNLSTDIYTGNVNDFVPPPYPASLLAETTKAPTYSPAMTAIASSTTTAAPGYELGNVHIMLNRLALRSASYPNAADNYSWLLAFGIAGSPTAAVTYGIYVDADHVAGSGGTTDPKGKAIPVAPLYLPEYVIYVTPAPTGDPITANQVTLYSWTGAAWDGGKSFTSIGGDAWVATEGPAAVQLVIPYGAIGANTENFSGSLAMTVFSSTADDATGLLDTIPPQDGMIHKPAFVSNLLMPLYPFDTPLSNPFVYEDMPPLRWRMPYYDSVDGYEVQVARDEKFTDLVETWEHNEKNTSSFYSFLTTAFQSFNAYADNESYYWRVRMRHERYTTVATQYDYSPWSPALRFKLSSRQVGNPQPPAGTLVGTTPTFTWERVDGAAGYTIQIDNDANFSSPLLERTVSGVSYTPVTDLPDGTYYWRVAARRSNKVMGRWSAPLSFVKQSLSPTLLQPPPDEGITTQPTFAWTAVLTPTEEPRTAAALYRLQLDEDPNFGSPVVFTTQASAFTLPDGSSIADGTWYWRVAVVDATGAVGAYSPVQAFYKEYQVPQLIQPAQNSVISTITSFQWAPIPGAAYYQIEIDDDPLFNSSLRAETDSTSYTPTRALTDAEYYWRVRMYDQDGKPGPFVNGRLQLDSDLVFDADHTLYLPLVQR